MTPAQTSKNILLDIRTQVVALVAAVQLVAARLETPAPDLQKLLAEQRAEVQAVRLEIAAVRTRTDSLALALARVDALVRVKCVETNNRLIRQMLECAP